MACNYGYASSVIGNTCSPTTLANCVNGYRGFDSKDICIICPGGYLRNGALGICEERSKVVSDFTYFIKEGA